MKIAPVKNSYYEHINFQGNKINLIAEKLSMRDFHANPDSSEFRELRNLYNNLYKNLSLPEDLKPRIQYKAMLADMSFSLQNYVININKHLSPFKMNIRNKTGKNEAALRHELEHLKQFWDIIRLFGADKATELFETQGICEVKPSLSKKMRKIEQTLGRISPNSAEGEKAQLYYDALLKYPSFENYYGEFGSKELMMIMKYKKNPLEKNARLAETAYKPSLLKTIKTSFQEFIKLITK